MQHSTYNSTNGSRPRASSGGTLQTVSRVLRRHWIIPVTLPVLVIAGTALALYLMPRVYEANAQLRFSEDKAPIPIVLNVLGLAIENRGTTFSDYRDASGEAGGFEPLLLVYGREGTPCGRCGTHIRRKVLSNRSAFYCPSCQS